MAEPEQQPSSQALIAAGVKPSALVAPPKPLWQRLRGVLVFGAAVWLVALTALAALAAWAALRPPEATPVPLDERAVQTLIAGALAQITAPAAQPGAVTGSAPQTPTAAPTDTATPAPIPTSTPAAQMRFSAATDTVPADGHTTVALTVGVQITPPAPGWSVRLRADAGALDAGEFALTPNPDGAAAVEAVYTPPTDRTGVVNVYATLLDDAGRAVSEQVVALQVIDEALAVVWLQDGEPLDDGGPAYLPVTGGESGLAFRLVRADGGAVLGTYTVTARVSGSEARIGGMEAVEIEAPPGAAVPLDITPAPDMAPFDLTITLPNGETAVRALVPMTPAASVTAALAPAGEGLAVCGAGDRTRQLTLALSVETEGEAGHPLLVSYEVVLGEARDAPLFRDADGARWAPGEVRQMFAAPERGGAASLTLFLVDGDWAASEGGAAIPGGAPVFYADAPGLARFTIRDAVSGVAAAEPVMVPVGLRRVRLAAPGASTAAVRLDGGGDYQFNPRRSAPPGPESGGGVLYTLDGGDAASVRVLATFWVRSVYLTQDAGDMATLGAVVSAEIGLTDAIPATTSLDWFRSLIRAAGGGVRSAEASNPDLLLPAGSAPVEVSYYGEREALDADVTNDLHRVYTVGTAPAGALAAWPALCPLVPPTPTATPVPPTPTETPTPSATPPQT
ncbi:MAG: hypothetical protein JXB47_15990 [Anaerolineae bacterium]|nr:hypothetical protein [Anaerolineae bacterium]